MTNPLLAQVTASLKRTHALQAELATKSVLLREAQLALRTGASAHAVGAALAVHLKALHTLGEKIEA